MLNETDFDSLFQQAVSAIDNGDENKLSNLLEEHPELAIRRLTAPGKWLTDVIPDALNGFFKGPYLLWFISEDAVRKGTLPPNIARIANIIVDKVKQVSTNFQEQIDFTLRLVALSGVAHKCGAQIELLDVLINAGAHIDGVSNDALINGNSNAANHLIQKGAKLTLPTALCLGMWEEVDQLAKSANMETIQFSLVLSALNGKAEAVRKAIGYGADVNQPSNELYSHGSPLHHAVWSGSLETVKILVEAGANVNARDTAYDATPFGWAIYGKREEVAEYLKESGAKE